jgi:hypothetical protein
MGPVNRVDDSRSPAVVGNATSNEWPAGHWMCNRDVSQAATKLRRADKDPSLEPGPVPRHGIAGACKQALSSQKRVLTIESHYALQATIVSRARSRSTQSRRFVQSHASTSCRTDPVEQPSSTTQVRHVDLLVTVIGIIRTQ